MEIKPLIRGLCPICNKMIMNEQRTSYANGGVEFFVLFQDGSNASFSCCEDCYKNITQEQLDNIVASQKINWGEEIKKTLQWFYGKAIHLRVVKHAKKKDELNA